MIKCTLFGVKNRVKVLSVIRILFTSLSSKQHTSSLNGVLHLSRLVLTLHLTLRPLERAISQSLKPSVN